MKVCDFDTLLVRMDKIGDLVLSLPVDQTPGLAERRCHWLLAQGTEFIAQNAVPKRSFTALPKKFSLASFLRLIRWLRKVRPETAIVLYAPGWVALALWCAGVPNRIGRLSQWWSFVLFNFGIRQRRSLGLKHEADYNVDLVEHGLAKVHGHTSPREFLSVSPLMLKAPQSALPRELVGTKEPYVVVHCGMAGSAFNWPLKRYVELIRKLVENNEVVLTGTAMDRFILEPLKRELDNLSKVHWFNERLSTGELLSVLSHAQAVVAPSTGVLHLAASLGVPTIGVYSPLPVHSPTRWGPRGKRTRAITPPSQYIGLEPTAEVMSEITVDVILTAKQELTVR